MKTKERKTLSKQSRYWRKKRKQMRINDSKMFSFRIKEFTVLKPEKSDTDAQWKTFRTSREKKKCSQRSMYLCWKRYYFAFHWHLRRLNRKVCCRMNEIPKSNKRPRWNKFTNKKKSQANKSTFNQRIFSSIMVLAIWKFQLLLLLLWFAICVRASACNYTCKLKWIAKRKCGKHYIHRLT